LRAWSGTPALLQWVRVAATGFWAPLGKSCDRPSLALTRARAETFLALVPKKFYSCAGTLFCTTRRSTYFFQSYSCFPALRPPRFSYDSPDKRQFPPPHGPARRAESRCVSREKPGIGALGRHCAFRATTPRAIWRHCSAPARRWEAPWDPTTSGSSRGWSSIPPAWGRRGFWRSSASRAGESRVATRLGDGVRRPRVVARTDRSRRAGARP